jgi:hypothetical protein
VNALNQTACNEQEFDRPGACSSCVHGTDCLSSPSFGLGDPLLSRSGFSHPRGKMDSFLPKVRIHAETVAVLQLRAAEHGMPMSEFVRIVLECVAFGTDDTASVQADRIRQVGAYVGSTVPREPGGR